MADQRDEIAQSLMAQNTGGLTPGDFATFSSKLNDPTALQGWLDKGGIYGQSGGTVPDPDEQYFGLKGPISHSGDEMNWMNALQPWQGGEIGGQQGSGINRSGFIGGGSMTRADPAYWGYQGAHQGYAPGSVGDLSGFNAGRSSAGSTGGLTPQDFATFSRLVSPQALQDWLNAGGVQGQFGGGMGGAVGGGGGGGGGGHGPSGSTGPGASPGRGGMSMGDALNATVAASNIGFDPSNTFAGRADSAFDSFSPSYAGSSVSNLGGFAAQGENPGIGDEGEGPGDNGGY